MTTDDPTETTAPAGQLAGPGRAHRSAPWTSHAAGKREQGPLRMKVLACYSEAEPTGLIGTEAAERIPGHPEHSVQARISELLGAGLLEATGEHRVSKYGSAAQVLRITAAGLDRLR